MIYYMDMDFCIRDCANTKCRRNKANINKPPDLEWMPVAYEDFKDCNSFKERRQSDDGNEA